MTKDQWLQIRDKEDIDISVFFEYYKEKGGYVTDLQDFERYFIKLGQTHTFLIKGRMIRMDYSTAVKKLYDYYNNKFQA